MIENQRKRIWGFVVGLIVCAGCAERPLEPRHKVSGPRVLAMIAEPPEIRPGQRTTVRLITGGMTVTPEYTWYVCARAESTATFVAQSTFGQAEPNDGCFGDAGANTIRLPDTGPSATITTPANLLQQIVALQAVYGSNISAQRLLAIARTAGLPITVAVEIRHNDPGTDGGAPRSTVLRALKRVVVIDRDDRNSNPPPPDFRVGVDRDGGAGIPMRYVRGPDGDERCEPADNAGPLAVRPGTTLELAPAPTEAPWLQPYTVLDTYGQPSQQVETAFYSFYSTGGAYYDDRTRIPTRNTKWEAPQRLGPISHWLVVRDGRGGASGCRWTIDVQRDAGSLDQRDASIADAGESPSDASSQSDASMDALDP